LTSRSQALKRERLTRYKHIPPSFVESHPFVRRPLEEEERGTDGEEEQEKGLELEVDLIDDPSELLLRSRLGFDDFKK